jgi:Glycosyltransferase family 87
MARIKPRNVLFTFVLLIFSLLIVVYAFSRPLGDFVEYWAAAHLLLTKQNPYSISQIFEIEKRLGWQHHLPLIALNPPWALPLLAPLGLTRSYPFAWLVWLSLQGAIVALSSRMLMDNYFGDVRIKEVSDTTVYRCLFAFTFFPTLLCLQFGQIAPLVLLGTAGLIYFEDRGHATKAGLLFGLTAVKPQLVFLLWIALALWSFQRRRWRVLVSALAVIASLSFVVLLLDRQVFRQYWELMSGPYPRLYAGGMVAVFRKALGGSTFWLQFMPLAAGLAWFVPYWRKHSGNWSWSERAPALITVSLLTSAWGFLFDQVLLAVPIIYLAARSARRFGRISMTLLVPYTILNAVLIVMVTASSFWAFVPGPVIAAYVLWWERRQEPAKSAVAALPTG